MINDKNRIYDGWISLEGGVDYGRAATLLEANQVVSAENMVFRGGHPSPRPGWKHLTSNFRNPESCYWPDGILADEGRIPQEFADAKFKSGTFQCAIGYSPHKGEDCIMALIGGRLFKIVPGVNDAKITEISLPYRNRKGSKIAYMVQADKWMIGQDGQSSAILYDGNIARRANETSTPGIIPDTITTSYNTDFEKTEVPVGTIMAYGMGRLVVIVNDRNVSFGDLYGSHAGPDPADSLIQFTERNFLAGGFDAAIPFQQGIATGMAFFPQLDTSTGNGQLMVFSQKGASAFFLSLPRELWQAAQFQIKALETTNLRGHRSITAVNEDLWFRSGDGTRSYRQARSEATGWAHIPLSTNVKQFLNSDTQAFLKFCSSIYFDNRVITTCSPYWNQGRPTHQGLVVVDFEILSSFGTKFRPAWDGHWQKYNSNVRISQLVTAEFNGATRAFFFGVDENAENQLYEITLDEKNDFDGFVEAEMVTRSMDFSKLAQQSTPFNENELYDGDLWLREIRE